MNILITLGTGSFERRCRAFLNVALFIDGALCCFMNRFAQMANFSALLLSFAPHMLRFAPQ